MSTTLLGQKFATLSTLAASIGFTLPMVANPGQGFFTLPQTLQDAQQAAEIAAITLEVDQLEAEIAAFQIELAQFESVLATLSG